jgi:hypothetical protein
MKRIYVIAGIILLISSGWTLFHAPLTNEENNFNCVAVGEIYIWSEVPIASIDGTHSGTLDQPNAADNVVIRFHSGDVLSVKNGIILLNGNGVEMGANTTAIIKNGEIAVGRYPKFEATTLWDQFVQKFLIR